MVAYTATSWKQLLSAKKVPKGEPVPRASDCYRFVLARPEVDVCMTGPANADQMSEALEALRRGPMSAEELAWMRRVGAAIHGK
jgi:aryl-alcohol dehydrogenase-like predicted oxidoreductase